MTDHINVSGQGGTFTAYIERPKTSPASAVIVLQELFGVNADIREHCDELAEEGFLAVAPDLFWRQEAGVDLTVSSAANSAFASICWMTEIPASRTSRPPTMQCAISRNATARLPCSATASAR